MVTIPTNYRMISYLWTVNNTLIMFKRLFLLTSILITGVLAFSQQIPAKSNTLVTDYTQTLSKEEIQKLESKLVAFNDSTSTQIAIVLIKTIGQNDINQFGAELGREWGIGQKGKNNGILILAAIDDRKVTIQTGYGAEGAVPDVTTHEIIQNVIVPHFKTSDYYGGLDLATDELIKLMKGEYKSSQKQSVEENDNSGAFIVLGIIVLFILISIFRRRGRNSQIIGGRGSASPFWWFLGGTLFGGASGWNDSSDNDSSGSSSGSDFDGFGGGDFGGGGSDGSW